MPIVVCAEILGENVLMGFSDGTSELISLDIMQEFMAELSGLFDQSIFFGGKPN